MSNTRPLTPERFDLAFRAATFRKELDALMAKHGANLLIGWEGKWMVLQVHFPDIACDEALTLIRADKRGKVRYLREDEEIMAEASRLGLKLDTQVNQK